MHPLFRSIARTATFACAALASAAAVGQVQILDSVDAFGSTPVPGTTSTTGAVLEMGFREGRPRDADFERLAIAATPILACQRGLDQGVVCVVGTTIRYWPDTDDVRTGSDGAYIPYFNVVDCKDSALKLDNRRPNSCTGVTVDADGAFWVAGRKANSHSLFKVVAKNKLSVSCTAAGPWVPLTVIQTSPELPSDLAPTYCAREFAFGRPTLEDVNAVDFVAAETFLDEGPAAGIWGVIGLEKREGVSFFPDSGNSNGPLLAPVEIVKTKSDWGLASKETLTTATLLQVDDGTAKKDYVLAVSSFGRVLALEIDDYGQRILPADLNHREVFKFPASRTNGARRCVDDSTQVFGVRVSQQSRRVYISDRNCGQVVALEWRTKPAECSGNKPLCLVNAKEPETTGSSTTTNVTLSTVDSPTDLSPVGVSVVQGVGYNLAADCGYDENGNPKTCAFVGDTDANGYNAAQISGVKVDDNGRSAMTVYQVIDVPDCRDTNHPQTQGAPCGVADIVRDGYLNVYPLLPPVIQDRIPATVTELWISPRYRGQVNRKDGSQYIGKRTIDLFFGVTEPGVRFRDTFEGLFDVDDLNDGTNNGNDLGCAGTPFTQNGQKPDLSWDAIVTVSEKVNTVKPGVADAPGRYDVLVNTGCFNPDGVAGARWSLYAYNLEPVGDGKDSYYATLLRELLADLLESQEEFACKNVDVDDLTGRTPDNAPLALSTCSSLTSKWNLAKRFLESCVTDATYLKKDQAVSNCNSFNSQVAGYRAVLENQDAPIPFGLDPANRVGELILRTKVLQYVYQNHFLPSIPPLGFCDLPGASCQP